MIMLSQRREVNEFRKRYKWMALIAVVVFALIAVRVAYIQTAQHALWSKRAWRNITDYEILPGPRGIIRDTQGKPVATNRPAYHLYIIPAFFDRDKGVDLLTKYLELSDEQRAAFLKKFDAISERRQDHLIEMFSDISREQLVVMRTHQNDFRFPISERQSRQSVRIESGPKRHYNYGSLGAHVIGYMNEVTAEDIEQLGPEAEYHGGDHIGRTGVEHAMEETLRGRDGFRRTMIHSGLERTPNPDTFAQGHHMSQDPIAGNDITLTIDMELMRSAARAFRGHSSGAAVVVDVNTGKVRALYSHPSYDLNEISAGLTITRYDEMAEDPFRPLIDKTVYATFFPGSTFKVISAVAGLQEHIFAVNESVECLGHYEYTHPVPKKCSGGPHGQVALRQALIQSCNVYFWKLAEQIQLDTLGAYAYQFGFGQRTGIGINNESKGFVPTQQWYIDHFQRFGIGFTLNDVIGQGNTRSTVLQLTMAYAAIANGGALYQPQLIESIETTDGAHVHTFQPILRNRLDVDPVWMQYVAESLLGVVNDQEGTAYRARIPGSVLIAGKTGTTQRTRGASGWGAQSHAWFAGFAPADNPQVAIAVLVEHGGFGGRVAAPIATRMLQEYLRNTNTNTNTQAALTGN